MNCRRSSGIILHPTSLPGPDGIGDLGPEAYRWVTFLKEAGCSLWQILPLGPTGYGDSPYQCFSAFAGNPYLISPIALVEDGILDHKDLLDRPVFPETCVDYGRVIPWKLSLLTKAFLHFQKHAPSELIQEFDDFQTHFKHWLDDFALFMAIKETQGGTAWCDWPEPLRKHEPNALRAFREQYGEIVLRHAFWQFLFFRQWKALRSFANQNGIQIIGDIPIFVAYDSSDVWSNRALFYLDEDGLPTVVAGVPPDYFSPTGQLWGNPLYRWQVHQKTNYAWWLSRFQATLQMVDIIRLDHFRGFAGYWEIPAGNPTAEKGRWVRGPGHKFFETLRNALGNLPIIAEDLGVITPDVVKLREDFELPGMKVFQFAFSTGPDDPFLPHNYPVNCVVYTGTHDNDTARGWYESAPEKERDFCRRYLARSGEDISWDMIRTVWGSVARFAIAPLQDFLGLGSEGRMNFPSKSGGNWSWRASADSFDSSLAMRIYELNYLYSRLPESESQKVTPTIEYENP
ncbi:MAG: 4-alpha-glucanotransferase [Anaerolineales bacterium]